MNRAFLPAPNVHRFLVAWMDHRMVRADQGLTEEQREILTDAIADRKAGRLKLAKLADETAEIREVRAECTGHVAKFVAACKPFRAGHVPVGEIPINSIVAWQSWIRGRTARPLPADPVSACSLALPLPEPARSFAQGQGPVVAYRVRSRPNRFILSNGHHRAVAFAAHGVTHLPCVVEEEADITDVSPDLQAVDLEARSRFSRALLMADRPPLLIDFLNPDLILDLEETRT